LSLAFGSSVETAHAVAAVFVSAFEDGERA